MMKSLLLVTALGAGLSAGVLFSFSSFVMSGLSRIPAQAGIGAMQSINITVINPVFMGVFLGTGVLAAIAAVMALGATGSGNSIYVVTAAAIYLLGTLGVTFIFNIPLNDTLAAVDPASAEGADYWRTFVLSWTAWNHVRCAAALVSSALFILARG